jgi:hypothetical protein
VTPSRHSQREESPVAAGSARILFARPRDRSPIEVGRVVPSRVPTPCQARIPVQGQPSGDQLRLARLPIDFFVAAVSFFGLALIAAPWLVGELVEFFYQPQVLALTHAITLGWITAAMMGVMYRYVPAVTKQPLRFPRLASLQFWLFVVGVAGLVAHFAIGRWVATWLAAAVVVLSVALFALNTLACLAPAVSRRGVAETGMFLAILHLLVAAGLGVVLALDKTFGLLGGSVVTNVAGHAHLAALGWVTLTVCAVSYRMVPAFLLPSVELPRWAIWQLYGLAASAAGLGIALLGGFGGLPFWAGAVTLAIVAYVMVLARLVGRRRLPIDWTIRHALAGAVWLLFAAGVGLSLVRIDTGTALGSRLVGAYGVMGFLGWVTNVIVGMSYHLFPGFIAGLRVAAGWPRVTAAELSLPPVRLFVFSALNAGVLVLAGGVVAANVVLARLGASILAAGGLTYVVVMARTLRFAYSPAVPGAACRPLRLATDDPS